MGRQTSAGLGKQAIFELNASISHAIVDGANGCYITSNKSLTCLQLVSRRIGAIFGMLSRRAGLSASAGLSCSCE